VRQVWFAGVHSDIGGGYPERGLGDVTLTWMLDHAAEHGLHRRPGAREALQPDPLGRIHESYQGAWKLLGQHVRKIPAGALIHESVHERLRADIGYAPTNLPEPATATGAGPAPIPKTASRMG